MTGMPSWEPMRAARSPAGRADGSMSSLSRTLGQRPTIDASRPSCRPSIRALRGGDRRAGERRSSSVEVQEGVFEIGLVADDPFDRELRSQFDHRVGRPLDGDRDDVAAGADGDNAGEVAERRGIRHRRRGEDRDARTPPRGARRSSRSSTSSPRRMMATRWAIRSTSGSTCDERNTVAPSATRSSINESSSCWSSGSRPDVGSSRMSSSGRAGEGLGDADLPAVARTQITDRPTGVEIESLQQLPDGGLVEPAPQSAEEVDRLAHRVVAIEVQLCGRDPDARPHGSVPRCPPQHLCPSQRGPPGCRAACGSSWSCRRRSGRGSPNTSPGCTCRSRSATAVRFTEALGQPHGGDGCGHSRFASPLSPCDPCDPTWRGHGRR